VYLRLKEPLLTLMSASSMEIKYTTLCHLELLIRESSIVFEDAYKSFFLQFDEPFQVKKIKLRILPLLANLDNYQEILTELTEYATDVNTSQARSAIQAVARLALQVRGQGVDVVLLKLLEYVESLDDRVRGDVLDAFKDVLQEFPDRSALVVPALPRFILKEVRCSAIWMLGEFGSTVELSPYLLERLVERLDELDPSVRCELLTALLKLFFKQRALEVRPALEKLFQAMLTDVSDVDAHDRAMFYFRLMKADLFQAGDLITSTMHYKPKTIIDGDPSPAEFFEEFNTLAVVYGKHAEQFVDEEHHFPARGDLPSEEFSPAQGRGVSYSDEVFLGSSTKSAPVSVGVRKYRDDVELSQQLFQQIWTKDAPQVKASVHQDKLAPILNDTLEERLVRSNIKCMASGNLGGNSFKYYFYAGLGPVVLLAEVTTSNNHITISAKSTGSVEDAERFARELVDLA